MNYFTAPFSRRIPVLTWDEANQIQSADDIPAIVARRPERRYIEAPRSFLTDGKLTSPSPSRHVE